MMVALLVGVVVALVVSDGSRPPPGLVCVPGSVSFKGSTAFAPIVNEVAALYERFCPGARITVRAVGELGPGRPVVIGGAARGGASAALESDRSAVS